MADTMFNLDYRKCNPDRCNGGTCLAVAACPLHLIAQEEQYDYPMANTPLCKGCARCVTACPFAAISLV